MTQKEKGPHENGSFGTAPDQNACSATSVVTDNTESVAATQAGVVRDHEDQVEPVDDMESQDPTLIYDSGWSIHKGMAVRVRWHGVPDNGQRRRWFTDLLSRAPDSSMNT